MFSVSPAKTEVNYQAVDTVQYVWVSVNVCVGVWHSEFGEATEAE